MGSGIRFFSAETVYQLKQKRKIRSWLREVVYEEKAAACDLSFVFCSDGYLLDLNMKFLDHSTFTDILTFPNSDDPDLVSGDIFISIDRIRENAKKYQQPVEKELCRVMVHGVLHLLGFKDKTLKEKKLMTNREDYYLEKIFKH